MPAVAPAWGWLRGALDSGAPGRRLERGMDSVLATGLLPRRASPPSRSRRRAPKSLLAAGLDAPAL
jgi:hypothetical protein